ncbi:hypothetical protein [Pedobacter nototheniae]|uniref:hypothetical protein n=1 Tax=Pedobacter nototheniae TaxID=2488994 RepID=UPI00103B528A|nr:MULTISPECIES: hypothetical protein [Pedobacter]
MSLKSTLITLAVAAIGLSACQNKPVDVAKDENLKDNIDTLSLKVAKTYVQNYAKRAGTVDSNFMEAGFSKTKKLPDTRAVWFSIARLKALVKKIEAEGGDGIRFYYAAYDSTYNDKSQGHQPPRPYWNHNTLIMISTKDSLKKYHRDYYNDKKVGSNGGVNGFIIGTTPENRGEMCPPPANCNDIGATLIEDKPEPTPPKAIKK